MVTGAGLVPHLWIWWLQGSNVNIFRMAVSAIAELSAEGLLPGPMDHKCVMMATAATRAG